MLCATRTCSILCAASFLIAVLVAASAATPAASRPAYTVGLNSHGLSGELQPAVDQSYPRRKLLESAISGWFKDVLKFAGVQDDSGAKSASTTPTPETPAAASGHSAPDTASTSVTTSTTTSTATAPSASSTEGASSARTTSSTSSSGAEDNNKKGKDKKDTMNDDIKPSQDAAEKLLTDAAASSEGSADPTVPATPLMPQPGEELPAGLKQVLQDTEQVSEAPAPVPLPADTVTLSFQVQGMAAETFTAQYIPTVTNILARLSGTSDKQWQSSINYKGQAAATRTPAPNPSPSPAPDTNNPVPAVTPSPVPVPSPSPAPVVTPSPTPVVPQPWASPMPAVASPVPAVPSPIVPAVSPQPAVPLPVNLPPIVCTGRGCATVGVVGHRRSLLQQQNQQQQQQEVQVRLSILTTNPQLVVYRLAQHAQDKNAATQLSCSSKLCYRLGSAGVPFERGTMSISPNYDLLFSEKGTSTSNVDEELANRRRLGGIAAGAVAAGFVLLLLLFTHKKWIRCCRAHCAASNLKNQSNKADKQQINGQQQAQDNKDASMSKAAHHFTHHTRRSRLIEHGKFDPRLSTSSSGINTVVAPAAAAAATTTPWVTLVTPMATEGMHRDLDNPNHQQQQLSDVYHYVDSFSRWVAASAGAGSAASPHGTPHSQALPQTPDSIQLDMAAALPASPISNPMYNDRHNSQSNSCNRYAEEHQDATLRFSPDQMELLLGNYYCKHEQQQVLADTVFAEEAAPSAPLAPMMVLRHMRYSCSSNNSSRASTRPATPVAGLNPSILSTSTLQGGPSTSAAATTVLAATAPAAAAAAVPAVPAAAAAVPVTSPSIQAARVVHRHDVATSITISNASSAAASWPVLQASIPTAQHAVALQAATPTNPVITVAQHGGVQYASLRAKYANRRPSEGV